MEIFTYLVAVAVPRQKSKPMQSQSMNSNDKGKNLTWKGRARDRLRLMGKHHNFNHAITVNPIPSTVEVEGVDTDKGSRSVLKNPASNTAQNAPENEDQQPERDSDNVNDEEPLNCKRCSQHQPQSVITSMSSILSKSKKSCPPVDQADAEDTEIETEEQDNYSDHRLEMETYPRRNQLRLRSPMNSPKFSLYHSQNLSHVIHHIPRFTICSSTSCTSVDNAGSSSDANKARKSNLTVSHAIKGSGESGAGGSSGSSGNSQFKFVCFLCGHEYPRESTLKNHLKVYHKIDPPDVSCRRN